MNTPIIDFNANTDHFFGEAIRFRLQKYDALPPTNGVPAGWLIDFQSSVYYWDGNGWLNLGQLYTHPQYILSNNNFASEQTSGLHIISQLLTNDTGHVIKIGSRTLTNADIVSIIINDAIQSGTFSWSSNKIKSFVESTVGQSTTGALIYQDTGYTPATAQGGMVAPIPSTSSAIKRGMVWVISAAGWCGSQKVSAGDMMIAKVDNASNVEGNYQFVEKNIPDIEYATQQIAGLITIATDQEALEGNEQHKAMTPYLTARVLDKRIRNASYYFGDGSSTEFTFNHGFGTKILTAEVFRVADNKKIYTALYTPTDNAVVVKILHPIGPNEYYIIISAAL